VFIPEKKLPMLGAGQPVRIVVRALSSKPYMGTVDRISPIVDARSGTVKATIAVGGQPGLRPGLFVEVHIVSAVHENALLIPKRALVYDNDQIFLYRVADEGHAERVLVQPILSNSDNVEPAMGFSDGDQVIIAGQAGLKDGARIEIVDPNAPREQLAEGDGEEEASR
jgi:membrane fusion protein (multidrug efflux system)